jgi:SAM-dependent methyltransferase
VPLSCRNLDAGCGTEQLAIFLSLVGRTITGIDLSHNSLRKANEFKVKFHIQNVSFAQMNLFYPALKDESFDYVVSNGVLHHTANAYGPLQSLCRALKPSGFFIVGLYSRYGRYFLKLLQRIHGLPTIG